VYILHWDHQSIENVYTLNWLVLEGIQTRFQAPSN